MYRGSYAVHPSQSVEVTVELQKLNGGSWDAVESWTASGPGIPGVELEKKHYVNGGTYRVCTTARVYGSGELLEQVLIYSVVVTY